MPALQSWRVYYKRFLGLGWARIFLVLGVLFTVLAILNPLWSTTIDYGGGDYVNHIYGWTTVTQVTYEGGTWSSTFVESYNARNFHENAIAGSLGASYLAAIVFLVVLVALFALFSIELVHRLPRLGLLIIGVVVVIAAFAALLYPALTVPSAAASDLGQSAITGYWGSFVTGTTLSWGAGLGWWLLLVGLIFGILGGIWPFLMNMRQPMIRAPPPREWQVER
jgi:hypothetical protein